MKSQKRYWNRGGPACEGTDHLPLIVHRSRHSAQRLGYVLGLGLEGFICLFLSICISVHMHLIMCDTYEIQGNFRDFK